MLRTVQNWAGPGNKASNISLLGVCTAQFALVHGMHSSLPIEYEVQEPSDFLPCGICGRTFNPDVLVRLEVPKKCLISRPSSTNHGKS